MPCLVLLILTPLSALAGVAPHDWTSLLDRLAADGLDRSMLDALYDRPEVAFHPETMTTKLKTLLAKGDRPASSRPRDTKAVHKDMLGPRLINQGRAFMASQASELAMAERVFGVDREVVVAILLVETRLGEFLGGRLAFNVLSSMAQANDMAVLAPFAPPGLVPPGQEARAAELLQTKSQWAYGELKALMDHARANGLDPLAIPGSIYGAIGMCQFMPSNAPLFGVDGDRNGRLDLFAPCDAIHSVANYLRGYGWRPGLSREARREVVFGYNHSWVYVNTVLAVADRLGGLTPATAARTVKSAKSVKSGKLRAASAKASQPSKSAKSAKSAKTNAKPTGAKSPAKTGK